MLNLARILVLITAVCTVAAGLLFGTIGIIGSFYDPGGGQLMMVTVSVSIMALTAGLGSALAWQAWQSIRGQASQPFRPQTVWPLGLFFLMAVLLGYLVLLEGLLPLLTLPLLHVAAVLLPALFIIALVGRGLGTVASRREMVLQFSSGAFLSTTLAFTIEFVLLIMILLVALVYVLALPGAQEQLQVLLQRMQDPAWVQNPTELISLAQSPIVVVLAFLVFAGAVPLIEEAVKTVGVGLMGYRRPSLPQAVLWGLAGGAGFAFAEGLLNSISGLDIWPVSVSMRTGATLLHCFTGALVGLAWYKVLAERRWGRALGLYALSVATHGLWNALAGGMALLSLRELEGASGPANQAWVGPTTTLLLALLVCMAVAVAIALAGLTRYSRNQGQKIAEAEDLQSAEGSEPAMVEGGPPVTQ